MSDLKAYDTEQLQLELERRARESEEKAQPKPLENPDWSTVLTYCIGYTTDLATRGFADSDDKQYIFEAAMEAVFGENVWAWVNEKSR